jgi:molecular chaperone GrpE (heat shock protein)
MCRTEFSARSVLQVFRKETQMKMTTWGACAAIGLGVFALGCDESTNTTPTPQVETRTTADKAADATNNTLDAIKDKASEVKDGVAEAAGDVKDAAKDAAADARDGVTNATNDAQTAATDANAGVVAQAQKLYDDAVAAVNKADFSTAEKYFEQLKTYRDKLPADWQTKIDQLGKMITDAKAKLGNVPGLPR